MHAPFCSLARRREAATGLSPSPRFLGFLRALVPGEGTKMIGDDDEIEIEIDLDDKDEGTHRVPGDPDRDEIGRGKSAGTGRQTPPPIPADSRRDRRAEQPAGGRRSESEKPSSPDSRWGGGRGR
jgi:hypothetical protein